MDATRRIDIDAPPEEVWDALATEEGRDRWLDEPDREVRVEVVEEPHRLVWWWDDEGGRPTRVEIRVVAVATGSRVVVTEHRATFPATRLAAGLRLALA